MGSALLTGGTRCVSEPTRIIRSFWSWKELVLRLGIIPLSASGVDADSKLVPAPEFVTNFMPSPGTMANFGCPALCSDLLSAFFVRTGLGAALRNERDSLESRISFVDAFLARIASDREVPLVGLYSYSKSPSEL